MCGVTNIASPELSIIVVTGSQRARGQRLLDALAAQSACAVMEVIVADVASDRYPRLSIAPDLPCIYLDRPAWESSTRARAVAISVAQGRLIGFLPDHARPAQTDWAECLIAAHQEPWAAVSYAILDASSHEYVSHSVFLADYGWWAGPVPHGRVIHYPGDYAVYKRDVLVRYQHLIDEGLIGDFLLPEALARDDQPVLLEAAALVTHEPHTDSVGHYEAVFAGSRLFAANRVRAHRWGLLRRALYAAAAPVAVPPLQIVRLARALRGRKALWGPGLIGLPIIYASYQVASFGEALGYLFGQGDAAVRFDHHYLYGKTNAAPTPIE